MKLVFLSIIFILIIVLIFFLTLPKPTVYSKYPTTLDVISELRCTPIAPSLNKKLFKTLGYKVCPF